MALAAASRRVSQLEEQYGVQLLNRGARGVELTRGGNGAPFPRRETARAGDEMQAELSDFTKGGRGLVRVHANASALAQHLPEDIAAFCAVHPAVKGRYRGTSQRRDCPGAALRRWPTSAS